MRSIRLLAAVAPLAGVLGIAARRYDPDVPIRPIGVEVVRTSDSIRTFTYVRPLSDGRVLMIDVAGKRLLLLDSTLRIARVIADSTPATSNGYDAGFTGLAPLPGDSTLTVDTKTSVFVVIDGNGQFARLIPAPRIATNPPNQQSVAVTGVSGGKIIFYQPDLNSRPIAPLRNLTRDTSVQSGDSGVVRRVDTVTWKSDTLSRTANTHNRAFYTGGQDVSFPSLIAQPPFRASDDVAISSDGTIAVVRAADYHVDWYHPDGTRTSSPPIASVAHLTLEMKTAVLDSVKASDSTIDARNRANAIKNGNPPSQLKRTYVLPADLPDARPPFVPNGTKMDTDGNLWIETHAALGNGGATYDVVNREGRLIDRVQLPPRDQLIAFGPGAAYCLVPPKQAMGYQYQLARLRIR